MVLCEMYYARQPPRPVLIKSLQKSSFIGQISQYFPAREVCDWSVLTKLSLRMGLVPNLAQIPYIIINDTLARSLEPVVTECKEHTIHTQTQIVASRKPKEIKHTHEGEANFTT